METTETTELGLKRLVRYYQYIVAVGWDWYIIHSCTLISCNVSINMYFKLIYHPLFHGTFHKINHPAIGVPPFIWVSYNDLTVLPHWKQWLDSENHPQMAASFRLVTYYNLPRLMYFYVLWSFAINGKMCKSCQFTSGNRFCDRYDVRNLRMIRWKTYKKMPELTRTYITHSQKYCTCNILLFPFAYLFLNIDRWTWYLYINIYKKMQDITT